MHGFFLVKVKKVKIQNTICNSSIIDSENLFTILTILKYRLRDFERGFACKILNDAYIIHYKACIFHFSTNYGGVTLETKFKVELIMDDLQCLFSRQFVP